MAITTTSVQAQTDELLDGLEHNLSDAVNRLTKQVIFQNGISFEIESTKTKPKIIERITYLKKTL